jgi:arylsulfatase A-like enzyme
MRLALVFLAFLLLALGAWLWFRLPPTPLPLHLLEACRAQQDPPSGPESLVGLGPETRPAIEARTPWRCEIFLKLDPASRLILALASHPGHARPSLRVSFDPLLGRDRIVREAAAPVTEETPGWHDVAVDLADLPRRWGRLRLEFAAPPGTPFYLTAPLIFKPQERPARNLLLVLLDTLRADHVGFRGYRRSTTPRLDALAAEGTILTNVHTPSSWTRPATATLLTGLDPADHGVYTRRDRVPARAETLAEKLRAAGYATSAFSSNPNVIPYWGFGQGFERFVDVESSHWMQNDDVSHMITLALAELDRIRERPFFLYLHVNQMHFPYIPPKKYLAEVAPGGEDPVDRYDGEIRFTDTELGRFWDRLRSLGLDDRTLLVVVADHGEEFGDHGGTMHGRTLYEEVLRIPLFLRWPGNVPSGRRVARPVVLADLEPLILSLLKVGPDGGAVRGLLDPDRKGAGGEEPLQGYKLDLDGRLIYGLREGSWKYIDTLRPVPREELYDLASDPGERHNLAETSSARKERLAGLLQRRLAGRRPGLHVRLSAGPQESRRLSLTLKTSGRVKTIFREGLDPGDTAEVSADEKTVEIHATAAGQEAPWKAYGSKLARYPDVDEITLLLDPPDSEVAVTVRSEDPERPLRAWRLGRRAQSGEARFRANAPELTVRIVDVEAAPEGDPAVWIYQVPAGSSVKGPIRKDVDERLRALGYVE